VIHVDDSKNRKSEGNALKTIGSGIFNGGKIGSSVGSNGARIAPVALGVVLGVLFLAPIIASGPFGILAAVA